MRRDSESVDQRSLARLIDARAALEHGDEGAVKGLVDEIIGSPTVPAEILDEAFELGVEAAFAAGDETVIAQHEAQLRDLRPARLTPALRATQFRLVAELAHRGGDTPAAKHAEGEAEALLRGAGLKPKLAVALLEQARRRSDPQALAEARAIYAGLGAIRWLERVDQEFGVVA
jgi:hypothetical protein